MRILIWHDKYGDKMWDASTIEKEDVAWLEMYTAINGTGAYEDISDDEDLKAIAKYISDNPEADKLKQEHSEKTRQRILWKKAKRGDALAARHLLAARKSYEYEGHSYGEVIEPKVNTVT